MKIRIIIKENLQSPVIELSQNPYPDPKIKEIIYKAKTIYKGIERSGTYGWLYPDGTFSNIEAPKIHGDAVKVIDPYYGDNEKYESEREWKIVEQGPKIFGSKTGSIRAIHNKLVVFTKITFNQLVWIRRNLAGEDISLFLTKGENQVEHQVPALPLYKWNQELNQKIIGLKLASFSEDAVLMENKRKKIKK